MALAEDMDQNWVPRDTFGARIALVRQHRGWNYAQAGKACGLSDESWRHWERGMEPRHYQDTCRKIAEAAGCSLQWLMSGGPISRCTWDDPSSCTPTLPFLGELSDLAAA